MHYIFIMHYVLITVLDRLDIIDKFFLCYKYNKYWICYQKIEYLKKCDQQINHITTSYQIVNIVILTH